MVTSQTTWLLLRPTPTRKATRSAHAIAELLSTSWHHAQEVTARAARLLHTELCLLDRSLMLLLLLLLLLLLELQVWRSKTYLLLELLELLWVRSLDLRIVIIHELLNGLKGGVVQLLGHLRVNLLNLLQVVYPNVLVSVGLKDITSDFPSLEA